MTPREGANRPGPNGGARARVPQAPPLSEAEARYRPLAEQVPAVTYVAAMGEPYEALYVGPQLQQITGYTQEEWLGRPQIWIQAMHPDDRERVLASLREAERKGSPWSEEYRLLARGGNVVWVRDECTPLADEADRPTYWQGVLLDISRRKEAEAAVVRFEARYHTLVELLPVVVYVDTPDPLPVTLYISPQVEAITGFPPERFVRDPDFWVSRLHPDDRDWMLEANRTFAETGEPKVAEYRMLAADGRVVWVRDQTTTIDDEDGRPLLCQGVWLDITEQKAAEEALRASEAEHRALVEEIPAVVYAVAPDDESTTLYVSPQVEKILGYSQQEWLDQPDIWIELLHPDDREPTLASHDLANETGEPWSAEYRLIASDGRHVWFHDEATLVRDEAGTPLFWHGVRLDITDRKLAEEALQLAHEELERRVAERTAELAETNEFLMLEVAERRRAEDELRRAETRYRALVEQIPGAVVYVWQAAHEGPLVPDPYVSPQIEDLLGYTQDEWHEGTSVWADRLHPVDRDRVIAGVRRSERTGLPFEDEYRFIAKDGRVVWLYDQGVMIERDEQGRPHLFHGVMYDVTERKRSEERLRQAEERYRTLVEQLPGAVVYAWEVDHERTSYPHAYVSPQIEAILGYPADEWYQERDTWLEHIHPDDRDRLQAATTHCKQTGDAFEMEYRYVARDGRTVWMHDRAELIERDELGRPALFHGVMFDVTERRLAEEQLRLAEERYGRLVEQIPAITYVSPAAGEDTPSTVYVSPQVEELLGYSREELSSEEFWSSLIHPEDRPGRDALLRRCTETGEPFVLEYRMRTKDGRTLWVHSEATLVPGGPEREAFWHGVVLDVTERRRDEERLGRAERLYRTLVEQIAAMTYVEEAGTKPDGARRITYVSPFVEQLLGYTPEEVMSDEFAWVACLHPDDRERAREADARSEETGEPFDLEYRLIRKDGGIVWVHGRAVLVRDEQGEPAFWQGVTFDINDRKRAEEDLRRLNDELEVRAASQREEPEDTRTLLEELGHGGPVLIFRGTLPDRTLTYVSPNVERVLGYPCEELVGVPDWWSDHLHPDDRATLLEESDEPQGRGEDRGKNLQRLRHGDGRYVWFHAVLRYAPGEDGSPTGFFGAAIPVPDPEAPLGRSVAGGVGFEPTSPSRD